MPSDGRNRMDVFNTEELDDLTESSESNELNDQNDIAGFRDVENFAVHRIPYTELPTLRGR